MATTVKVEIIDLTLDEVDPLTTAKVSKSLNSTIVNRTATQTASVAPLVLDRSIRQTRTGKQKARPLSKRARPSDHDNYKPTSDHHILASAHTLKNKQRPASDFPSSICTSDVAFLVHALLGHGKRYEKELTIRYQRTSLLRRCIVVKKLEPLQQHGFKSFDHLCEEVSKMSNMWYLPRVGMDGVVWLADTGNPFIEQVDNDKFYLRRLTSMHPIIEPPTGGIGGLQNGQSGVDVSPIVSNLGAQDIIPTDQAPSNVPSGSESKSEHARPKMLFRSHHTSSDDSVDGLHERLMKRRRAPSDASNSKLTLATSSASSRPAMSGTTCGSHSILKEKSVNAISAMVALHTEEEIGKMGKPLAKININSKSDLSVKIESM